MIHISVPATSANLGSGFDALALAFDLRMEARAHSHKGNLQLVFGGSERPTHDGLAACVRAGMKLIIPNPNELALRIEITNAIPLGVGLGSSAAALLCGAALAAYACGKSIPHTELFALVARAEGHGDNAAAAVYGGVCAVLQDQRGQYQALPFPIAPGLRFALVVPNQALSTSIARQALPREYPQAAVIRAIQRAAVLSASLASGQFEQLFAATQDAVHQPYRAGMIPGLPEALDLSSSQECVVLSGAGPSVLLFSTEDLASLAARAAECFIAAGVGARVIHAQVDRRGLQIHAAGLSPVSHAGVPA